MSIHQMDNKGIVKSDFVTSCLAFRGSIPTVPSLTKFVNSHSNISLFIFHQKILILYLAIYANEIILISNNEHLLANFFFQLSHRFSLKDLTILTYFLCAEVFSTQWIIIIPTKIYCGLSY